MNEEFNMVNEMMDLNTTPEVEQTETYELAPVEECVPVAEVVESTPVETEEEKKGVSGVVIAGVVAAGAGIGYGAYRLGKKIVEKAKDSKVAEKIREKRFERAKRLVLSNGYIVRPAVVLSDGPEELEEPEESEETKES